MGRGLANLLCYRFIRGRQVLQIVLALCSESPRLRAISRIFWHFFFLMSLLPTSFSSGKSGASGSGKDLNDKLQDYLKKAKERQKKSSSDKKKWGVCKCTQTFWQLCKKILQIYAKANEGKSIMQLFVKKSLPS